MTDVAYLCHNCGSVHEVESIRENLILDLRTAASYEVSGQRGTLDPRARFLRWRMTWRLAQALWPGYSHHRGLAWARRLVQGPPAPVSDRPVPCRAATGGSDACAGNPALAGTHDRGVGVSVDVPTRSCAKIMISQSEAASPQAAARNPVQGISPRAAPASILSTPSGNGRSAAELNQ